MTGTIRIQRSLPNLDALREAARDIVARLQRQDAVVFLLEGPLGSGKTTFVSALVGALGGGDVTSSPTFVLHQEYETPNCKLHHFDLYRLEEESELESAGLWDLVAQGKDWLCLEWPSKLGGLTFPSKWRVIKVQFSVEPERAVEIIF